jgi:hypothetical protein
MVLIPLTARGETRPPPELEFPLRRLFGDNGSRFNPKAAL